MGKIATEQEAYNVGKLGTPVTNKCCTNSRAQELGCIVSGNYRNYNQLVQQSDLSEGGPTVIILNYDNGYYAFQPYRRIEFPNYKIGSVQGNWGHVGTWNGFAPSFGEDSHTARLTMTPLKLGRTYFVYKILTIEVGETITPQYRTQFTCKRINEIRI